MRGLLSRVYSRCFFFCCFSVDVSTGHHTPFGQFIQLCDLFFLLCRFPPADNRSLMNCARSYFIRSVSNPLTSTTTVTCCWSTPPPLSHHDCMSRRSFSFSFYETFFFFFSFSGHEGTNIWFPTDYKVYLVEKAGRCGGMSIACVFWKPDIARPFFALFLLSSGRSSAIAASFLSVCEREFPDCSVQSAFVSYPVSTVAFPIASPRGQQRKM